MGSMMLGCMPSRTATPVPTASYRKLIARVRPTGHRPDADRTHCPAHRTRAVR